MSAIQDNQGPWSNLASQKLDPKYEKCRNITEEIYKRINITFQIKKLESGEQSDLSDNSDQIDSNELSNETDLFACDKSDIPSSTDVEGGPPPAPLIPAINNNNNNEERKAVVYKRPRKRFRKRVKKRSSRRRSDSEGSSDEAPLSRTLLILAPDVKPKSSDKFSKRSSNNLTLRELLKPDDIKVPTVIIEKITIDKDSAKSSDKEIGRKTDRYCIRKPKDVKTDKSYLKHSDNERKSADSKNLAIDINVEEKTPVPNSKPTNEISKMAELSEFKMAENVDLSEKTALSMVDERKKFSKDVKTTDWKNCGVCNLSFRGERGLRRHMSMSHIESSEEKK